MGRQWETSNYNFIYEAKDGKKLVFNALSGALVELADKQFRQLERILFGPEDYITDAQSDSSLFEAAIHGGFIHKADMNEFDVIKMRSHQNRFNTEHFHLTIMPTLSCNFKCTYCYEESVPGIMSRAVERRLAKWVETKVKTSQSLTVGWFGGEPLLAWNCIRRLSHGFRTACKQYDVKYAASLTSNGYLLDTRIVDQLDELGITGVQVTIDGPKEIHDRRRPLKSGKGNFEVLVRNLEYLVNSDLNVAVWVRVNCDSENIGRVSELFDVLPDCIKQRADIYFAEVYSCASFIGHEGRHESLPVGGTMSEDPGYVRKKLRELQFTSVRIRHGDNPLSVGKYVFRPKSGYCEADFANRFVVDPDGDLHKCTVSFSKELRVGYISDEGKAIFDLPKLSMWLSKDPFGREKCEKCKALPLCMGGCQSAYLNTRNPDFCATLLTPEAIETNLGTLYEEYKVGN